MIPQGQGCGVDLVMRKKKSIQQIFWDKVEKGAQPNDCWLWTGCTAEGYGQVGRLDGKGSTGAHRYSYELHKGPIPPGLHIDHLCMIHGCVNPDHLEAVTREENSRRYKEHCRKVTHCKNGHAWTQENTWIDAKKDRRSCKACSRENKLQRRRRGGKPVYAIRSHCPNGHEYTKDNIHMTLDGRTCRTCERAGKKRSRRRKAAIKRGDAAVLFYGLDYEI